MLVTAAGVVVLILCWQIAAILLDSELILPSPIPVLQSLIAMGSQPIFWQSIGATCLRGLYSFAVALGIAVPLGIASGRFLWIEAAVSPLMTVITSTPVVSLVLLAMFWFGSETVPVFVAVLMTVPVISSSAVVGIKTVDRRLLEMCDMYQIQGLKRLWYVYVPHLLPIFLSSVGTALSLTWKVIAAGEVLSLPQFGAGTGIQSAKIHLETSEVFAWTIAMLFLSGISEYVFKQISAKIKKSSGIL